MRGKTGWGTLRNTFNATLGSLSTTAQTAGHAYTKTLEITLDAIPGEAGALIATNARKAGLKGLTSSIKSNESTAAAIDSIYYTGQSVMGNTAYAEWAKGLTGDDKDDLRDEEFDNIVSKAIYRNKMNVAYSIPCFEYWLLLHFDYYNTPLTTKDCIKKLKNRFPVYRKNLDDVYYKLADKKYSAIENAKRMEDEHKKQGNTKPSSKNPSTLVYKLVIELEKFLK